MTIANSTASDRTAPSTCLTDRAIIRLSGDDVRGFLQGLVTQDVLHGLPVWAGLLTPQGKVIADFLIWSDGDDLLIDAENAQADALIAQLSRYRLRRAIIIARDDRLHVHWSMTAMPDYEPDPRLAALGWRAVLPLAGPSADDRWRAHRLAHGVTEGVTELGQATTLWLECNAAELNGVSFIKGCYVGQENTARMNWRQKINRRLFVGTPADIGDHPARILYPATDDTPAIAVTHLRVDEAPPLLWRDWMKSTIAQS